MKRIYLTLCAITIAIAQSWACTNLIVGRHASTDGSTIVSYSADSYGLFGELYHYPAGTHAKGTMRPVTSGTLVSTWAKFPRHAPPTTLLAT